MLQTDHRWTAPAAVVALAAAGVAAAGTFDSSNVSLLSNIPLSGFPSSPPRANDCWGYVSPSGREYALMGLNNALAVVEVTDPVNPVIIESFSHVSTTWCDVKTYQHYAYVVTDNVPGGAGFGIRVLDLDDVDNGNVGVILFNMSGGQTESHNVIVDTDSGYLYLAGADVNNGRLMAFSLADPTNPTFISQINDAGSAYCHDAEVITYDSGPYAGKQIAFCANGGAGLDIYDVTNKASMTRLSRTGYANLSYTHQVWVSDDRHYAYVNDELDTINRTGIFDISNLSNPVLVNESTSGVAAYDHNVYYHDGFVYEAEYEAGLRVFCALDPVNPVQVGWFDTYPPNDNPSFNGAWSCYPFFPSGNVLVSDRDFGLFMVDVSAAKTAGGLTLALAGALPDFINPVGGTAFDVDASSECGGDPAPGTGVLHYDDGTGYTTVPMQDLGPGSYRAVFPAVPCGMEIHYYVSIETVSGAEFTLPAGAPGQTLQTTAAYGLIPDLVEDFEQDNGWTTSFVNATSGFWERGVPVNDPEWPYDPESDADGSGQCWVTGNVLGQSDVDGGWVVLTSPDFEISGEVLVGYDYYLNLPDGGTDSLRVEVSANGAAGPWVQVALHQEDGGTAWRHHEFTPVLQDDAGPGGTVTMTVRFTAGDLGPDTTIEAGIDGFRIDHIDCIGVPGDLDGNGVVDTVDFLMLLGAWGPCPAPCPPACPGDLDGNCNVDTVDFLMLLANWG